MRNVFEIVRKSQQLFTQRRLPQCLPERTKKDKLFNDLLNLLETKKWEWAPDGVESERVILTTLTNILWYLDSHHDTLSHGHAKYQSCSQCIKGSLYPKPQNN